MKRSKLLLVSLIIGALYTIYICWYFFGGGVGSAVGQTSSAQLGASIATAVVMPHMAMTVLALVFNALAYFMNKSAFALVAGILYAVALVLMFIYAFGVIVEMILCFVAYAKMRKQA